MGLNIYHYLESGLRNVWLANGYRKIRTPDGDAIAIENVAGLHRAIGCGLLRKPKLTGAEFRFLRKELGLSQVNAGELFGVSGQSVALWEKHGRVPGPAERLLRVLYQATVDKHPQVMKLLQQLHELDRRVAERMNFTQDGEKWKLAA